VPCESKLVMQKENPSNVNWMDNLW